MVELLSVVLLGLPMTVVVTAGAFALGAVLALPLAALARSRLGVVRLAVRVLIDLLRGVPPIVWLFIIYFGLSVEVIRLSSLQAAVLGLGLISAGYLAEVYRGGIAAVGRGQWEAAQALGLGHLTVARSVVAPQAFRVALPSATTYLIGLIKDSSIASTIGVAEIVFRSTAYARQNYSGLAVFATAAVVYIAVSAPLAMLSRSWDARLRSAVAR